MVGCRPKLTRKCRAGSQSLSLLLPLLLPLSPLPPLRRRRSSLRRRSLLSLCLRLFSLPRFSFFSFFRFLLQGTVGSKWDWYLAALAGTTLACLHALPYAPQLSLVGETT